VPNKSVYKKRGAQDFTKYRTYSTLIPGVSITRHPKIYFLRKILSAAFSPTIYVGTAIKKPGILGKTEALKH